MVLVKNRWGWVVAFTTFVVCIPITGILSAFGIIFVKLQGEYPEITDLETGWIGSMAFGMFFFASPISTGLFKRFGHRKVSFIGVFFVSVGLLGSSFVPHPRMLFLTYSILFGVGANFVDNASLNLIGQYFPRKNSARATCFATLGWSVGSLALNPSVEALCESVGWRNTFRILSGLMFVIGISCVVTFAPAPVERHWKSVEANLERKKQAEHASRTEQKQTVLVYLKTFKKTFQAPGIILWFIGNVLLNLSLIFPFINMVKFMTTIGIPESRGALVLTAMGITDLIGRTGSALFGDRLPFHVVYIYPLSTAVMALGIFSLLFISSFVGMVIFASGFGLVMGIVNSMLFKACMDIFGMELLAEAWTVTLVAAGFGIMVGPSIAGTTYDLTRSFTLAFYIGGGLCALGAVLLIIIPFVQKRKHWNPKSLAVTTSSTDVSMLTDDSGEMYLIEAHVTTI